MFEIFIIIMRHVTNTPKLYYKHSGQYASQVAKHGRLIWVGEGDRYDLYDGWTTPKWLGLR